MKTRLKDFLSGLLVTRRQNSEGYRALFEGSADAILICDSAGNILDCNPSATVLLGYSNQELVMLNIGDLYCKKEARQRSFSYDKLLARTTTRKETVFRLKSFRRIQVEVTEQLLDDGRFIAIIRDISEQKKNEETLTSTVERYHTLARAYGDTVWDWDLITNARLYDPGLKKLFGYNLRHIDNASKWANEKTHPEDLPGVIAALQETITNKQRHLKVEYRFLCADGTYKYILDRSFVVYNANMNPIRIIGSMQDITQARNEEKYVAKAILEAQEKERRHIGQELHDNINQILASAHMTLYAAKDFRDDLTKTQELITVSRQRIEEALIEIRKLSHQLAPAVPDGALLKDVFLELLNSLDIRKRYKIDFQFDEKLNGLANETIMLNLYRILQEQLKNIVHYSEARNIAIIMKVWEKHISFTIGDDGRGFDMRNAKKGIGLNNIRKRVEALNGKLTIITAPGEGCVLISEIPF